MLEHGQFWRNKALREHVAVVDGKIAPTIVLENCTYLNVFTKKWLKANVWIYQDRIVYVGDRMPEKTEGTEIMECTGQYVVPGYVEPHAHPVQLYNPEMFARHAATYGTTTFINDNLFLLKLLEKKQAFQLMDDFNQLPVSMFWWGRFDSQSMLANEEAIFNTADILDWIHHPSVVQGGELTSWPELLAGDDRLLYWIQETKKQRKKIEGHFPGASKDTLTRLKLLGATADHESMTKEEVMRRLELGYHAALRHSSIRPDLAAILEELIDDEFAAYDQLMFTTDGSTPSFIENGVINQCLDIAMGAGVPLEEAYRMASYNVAAYYDMDHLLGSIAPGRIAHLNILYEKDDPNPFSVLAKGEWIKKDGVPIEKENQIDWEKYGLEKAVFDWELTEDDFQFSIPVGIKMINDVITKPYAVEIDITTDELSEESPDAFLMMIDREGKWCVNTVIQGFTDRLGAICSSFTTTDDVLVIGKKKTDMKRAMERMKEIGGGIVIVHEGEILMELPLHLHGQMYHGTMEELIEWEKSCIQLLKEAGYQFEDPVFNLLFLSSTHLPYIRISPMGIIDVLKREVIVPANMR
ncbi:MAG TPA: adenine deaminase C-terminal domain-containing protein [Pseudogracilibacillus sp.]|nr:adenine deaminase C-terminal domain-containing protein [Pseudogracilibacillus sp.]